MQQDKAAEERYDELQRRMHEIACEIGRLDSDDPRFELLVEEMFRLGELTKQFEKDVDA